MDPRERQWIDDGLEALFGPWTPPTLRADIDDRAARLTSPFGRRPATHYGWGADEDDPHLEDRLEAEARRQEQAGPDPLTSTEPPRRPSKEQPMPSALGPIMDHVIQQALHPLSLIEREALTPARFYRAIATILNTDCPQPHCFWSVTGTGVQCTIREGPSVLGYRIVPIPFPCPGEGP